ncbi:type I polyketide synthase [Streptomyces sp. NPDC008086]|uniref:type I polyketide synthase n=1 Tax=Streptomyces sp. NPDC008086 TaxID=3364807 RepID=UPI0036F18B51
MNDIAIVGLGCRFPGAADLRAYWKLLLRGERQFTAVPKDRWNHDTFHRPGDPQAPDSAYTDQVAFLRDVDRFAAAHYGLPPRRAEAMDPQHRLALDVTREALDDAGLGRGGFDRERTGVFFGVSVSDYRELATARLRALGLADGSLGLAADSDALNALQDSAARDLPPIGTFTMPGVLLNMAPAAVSRHFGLGGPSFTVDAACSSSLVALDHAVAQLRRGACAAAVVGGVYLSLTPDSLVGFSRLGALSAAGVCRPFDSRADGFVLGEGAGAVILRPLQDALVDGNRVYAVIKGVGSANDGASTGPLTPSAEGQLRAMRGAFDDAGLSPDAVSFIEAHGTGTSVGDRAEVEALRRLRTEGGDRGPGVCYLSSGKALIGHSLSAAGIAGLIKTALVVHHRTVVPQPDVIPHPELGLDAAGLRVADTARALPRARSTGAGPVCAAVSSFGFGGTNVHAVLQQAPTSPSVRRPSLSPRTHGDNAVRDAEPQLALISAGSPQLLREHIDDLLDHLEQRGAMPAVSMAALAHTLAGREPLPSRLAIVAGDTAEFTERLRRARRQLAEGARGDLGDGAFAADAPLRSAARRIAFVYPGQGSQRPGMMRELHERYPDFRDAVDALGAEARRHTGVDPADLLYGPTADSANETGLRRRLAPTEVCQPLLGTVQLAATGLLAASGVVPDVVLGHSVGEFAAAATAGVLPAEETVALLARRGAVLRDAEGEPRGSMLAVQTDEETCRRLVEDVRDVWVACFNEPRQTVVSGSREALDALRRRCAEAGIATRALEVSNAFHSPRLAAGDEAMRADLDGRPLAKPRLPLVSCVSGTVCDDPDELRRLWSRHACAPVRFSDAVRSAYDAGARLFVQVTGGNSLLSAVRRNLAGQDDVHVVAVDNPAPDAQRGYLGALARLAVLGVDVDVRQLIEPADRQLLNLPIARLETRSYWWGPRPTAAAPGTRTAPTTPTTPPTPPIPAAAPRPRPSLAPTKDHPMQELLDLIQHQVTLLGRLGEALTDATHRDPAQPAEAAQPAQRVEPARPAAVATETEAVQDAVFEQIARISAFPASDLHAGQRLVDDLGFDSLMLTDLFTSLKRRWPSLTVDERCARPTVGSVTALVREAAMPGPSADPIRLPRPADPSVPEPRHAEPRHAEPRHVAHIAPTHAEPTPAASPPPVGLLPQDQTRIDRFPEVTAHQERMSLLDRLDLPNPYLRVHEGGMTDTTVVDGRELISFSGFNYLGLASDPRTTEAVEEAVARCGTSASASRLLSGSRPLHLELERELADTLGTEDAITLTSGHATNVTVIGHLVGPDDLIVHDSLAHDSILQGCRLSGATRRPFPHNDAAALDALLTRIRHQYRRVLVVVEGVYSMDGDIADLPALIDVKRRHGALLMVDEAHSIGVIGATGRGIGEYHDVDRGAVDLWGGTLSKALAGCGGYIGAGRSVVEYLRYTAPGFVYSAGMTPANAAASLAALRTMRAEPQRLTRLRENSALFVSLARRAGVDIGASHDSPIVPCIVGDSARTLRLAEALFREGISVNPILHPAVPEELTRLRFFVTCAHTPDQIRRTVDALRRHLPYADTATAAAA